MALFGPGRDDAVLAGVGDGLAEMLAVMSADEEKRAANGGILPEQFQRIIEIGILDGENRAAEMGEGIFEGLHGFGFVGGAGVDGFGVDAGGRGSAEGASDAVIGGGDVGVDFADGADTFGGAPGIFFGGDGFGEAGVALLVAGELGEEFTAFTGDGGISGGGGGLVLGWSWMREKHDGAKCEQNCRREMTHGASKVWCAESEKDFTTECPVMERGEKPPL